jgi:hypothetical protein
MDEGRESYSSGGSAVILAAWLYGVAGVILASIGVFFILLRPSLLPEDLRYLGESLSQIDGDVPQLQRWLQRVFIAMGGQALAAGGLTVYVAATGVRDGRTSAVVALAFAGVAATGIMAVINFAIRSDFRWMLLGLLTLWGVATASAVWLG